MHRRWLSLPLLSNCASAFYPYDAVKQGTEHKDKRFFPISHADRPYDDHSVVSVGIKKLRRDNTFPVVSSNPPTLPNEVAINQDGADFSYFATAKFGSKGQDMYMLIDTGSANTWIMGSDCKSNSCAIHNTFGSADSSSLNMTSEPWGLSYGTGSVEGVIASDKVSFGNWTIDLEFGLANSASDDFNNYPMDGIFGLGPSPSNDLGTSTIMEALDQQTSLRQNMIGVHLSRASDGDKDGLLTIGGVDSSKFNGKLSYTPISNPSAWELSVDDVFLGGSACKFSGKSAIIDSGTSYILMPPADAAKVHALIPGSSHSGEIYTIPCGTSTTLQISFSGVKYAISAGDYVGKPSGGACASNIIGHQAYGPDEWILGDTFMKNVYTVFDFDKDRIGFATMSASTSGTASASSTSGKPTGGASSTGKHQTATATATSSESASATSATASPTASGGDSSPVGESAGSDSAAHKSVPAVVIMVAFVIGSLI